MFSSIYYKSTLPLKQPKMLPSHITVECQKICINHHKTSAKKPSLIVVRMTLDQA